MIVQRRFKFINKFWAKSELKKGKIKSKITLNQKNNNMKKNEFDNKFLTYTSGSIILAL